MNPKIKPKIRKLFAGGSLFPCIIFYIVGLSWFLLLSQDELNNETYLSENALLVGQVVERFDDLESINQFYENARKLTDQTHGDTTKLQKWIAKQLDAIGLEVYMQNFTFSHDVLYPIKSIEGTNLYGIMRSPSGGRTEALLLTVPLHSSTAGSVALVLSLLKTLRQQIYWAKDIVVVFPESEYTGLLAWIEAYHGGEATTHLSWTELEGRSGNIQAGLNLEFTTPDIQSVDIFPEGVNGLLANLDLVNTVVRIAHKHSIQSVVNGQPFYFLRGDFDSRVQDVFGLAQAVWTQAPGSPAGLHGLLINYQIPAVTLRGPSPYVFFKSSRSPGIKTGKFLEGILRSLNNLQERMHQSFWYYLLPSPLRYISIGVYMPPVLILIGSLLIKVIGLWLPLPDPTLPPTQTASAATEAKKPDTSEEPAIGERREPIADEDQTVRKRHVSKKSTTTGLKKSDHKQHKTDRKTVDVDLLSALADISVWSVAAFGAGLGFFASPKLVFSLMNDPYIHTALHSLGLETKHVSAGDFLAVSIIVLFFLAVSLLPLLTSILRWLFKVRSSAPFVWKRSIILIGWALFLSCFTCLNVSASLVLSVPIVPFLLIFLRSSARSKFISALFGFCWLVVSPLSILLAGCVLYLTVYDEALLTVTRPMTSSGLWACFTRAVVQALVEADLFGCWTWSAFTCVFTSLWLLTWLDIALSR